ncbi:hypothetical protein SKAU_G00276020 [Synaphobranchus kaupii]|uniref:Peptidase A2 domain-containing protein n=1 Tax=Synaphobranchus kaupii TaxID=118154 RepID=A0A9Q1F1A8_SYNKA|nr:hypothetical protein SKAU_G00276020 [Synaphobranchus kaupii]
MGEQDVQPVRGILDTGRFGRADKRKSNGTRGTRYENGQSTERKKGNSNKYPVHILRDTGAAQSFVIKTVVPFSSQSATGDSVLVCGIGSTQLNVPLHCVNLESDLVWGEVVVGVLSVLPVEGVDVILGNDLAGALVWGDASVVVKKRLEYGQITVIPVKILTCLHKLNIPVPLNHPR